jgi:hypothetical protein
MSAVRARAKPRWRCARPRSRRRAKKAGGRPPQPAIDGPPSSDQVNLTDEEYRIMPVTCGRFEQFYNARAAGGDGQSDGWRATWCKAQRQEPGRTDAEEDRRLARGDGQRPKICWRTLAISAPRMWKLRKAGVEPTIVMDVPISRHFTRRFAAPLAHK